jgi:hypothetical protein
MRSEALQRLETLLHARKLGATVAAAARTPVAVARTGADDLDRQLDGGWPCGAVSELVGRPSTGRTGLLVSTLARAAAEGQVVALVDTCDRFDPRSAAGAGLDLDRLLWVRGAPLTVELARPAVLDRALRQAVRAFDLILRAGGFAVVVLDLADVPAAAVRRLPPATWLRLAHVNEGRPTVGLIVGTAPVGRSARGVSVQLEARPVWTGSSPQNRRFEGFKTAWRLQSATRPRPRPDGHDHHRAAEYLKDCG